MPTPNASSAGTITMNDIHMGAIFAIGMGPVRWIISPGPSAEPSPPQFGQHLAEPEASRLLLTSLLSISLILITSRERLDRLPPQSQLEERLAVSGQAGSFQINPK
jgi:hypothetical protein